MKKVLTIVGARPQFIKAAPMSKAFLDDGQIEEILVHTGQHYDENMSEIFFEQLQIPKPHFNLHIGSSSHAVQTASMMMEIEKVIDSTKPDGLLVYGDTNSTLAAALTGKKKHIPIFHIESGLRSFDQKMPEEVNRIMTDHISDLLFCPSLVSKKQLIKEGLDPEKIFISGDIMKETLEFVLPFLKSTQNEPFLLVTIHRQENTDNPKNLNAIFDGLIEAINDTENRAIVPMHPRTRKMLGNQLSKYTSNPKISIIEPVGFIEMVSLIQECKGVITDSGGLQKEAYFLQKPCLTVRDSTEWTELIDSGWNRLCSPTSSSNIAKNIVEQISNFTPPPYDKSLYGEGKTSKLICQTIFDYFSSKV